MNDWMYVGGLMILAVFLFLLLLGIVLASADSDLGGSEP